MTNFIKSNKILLLIKVYFLVLLQHLPVYKYQLFINLITQTRLYGYGYKWSNFKMQSVCMKMDLFFFQYLCVFTVALNFLYIVVQSCCETIIIVWKQVFLPAKIWAKKSLYYKECFWWFLEREKTIFTWTAPQWKSLLPKPS